MAEYIEREALLEKAYWHGKMPDFDNLYPDGVEAVDVADIDEIPAADVVAVVRCKDCVWWENGEYSPICNHHLDGLVNPCSDDFCSYGEKREEDGT